MLSRPRASGGHPAAARCPPSTHRSSPRERGSSGVCRILTYPFSVVPARAGVIRAQSAPSQTGTSRPRASGGHPGEASGRRAASYVVPARAGVIRRLIGELEAAP